MEHALKMVMSRSTRRMRRMVMLMKKPGFWTSLPTPSRLKFSTKHLLFGRRGKMCGWSCCCCAHVQSWFAWLPVGLSASLQLRRKENPPQCHPTTALLRCVAFIHLPCPPKEGEKMVGQEKITRKLWCENMPFQWAIDGALTMELMLQKFAKHTHIHTHRHTHKFPLAWDTSGTQHLLSDVSRCIEPPFGLGVK